MKFLLLHGPNNDFLYESGRMSNWIKRLQLAGISVNPFVMPLKVKGIRMPWHQLDFAWKSKNKDLLNYYDDLARVSEGYDVLLDFGGGNLHPDFLKQLKIITVFQFNDDPEASEHWSKPVAHAYDICAIGNIAAIETYKSWGIEHVYWTPHGFFQDDYKPNKSIDELFTQPRDVDVSLLCERLTLYRKRNVDKYVADFPQGVYYGRGWPKGFLPEKERVPLLQRTKIGINIHNSTGPINYRTYYLPANGILQICDNKSHLGKIYELNKEVVGFDNIDEAIDLTRYYLSHENDRLEIAIAGYKRVLIDYNEVAAFNKIIEAVNVYTKSKENIERNIRVSGSISIPEKENAFQQFLFALKYLKTDMIFKTLNFFHHKLPRYIGVIKNAIHNK